MSPCVDREVFGTYHKIAFDKSDLVSKSFLLDIHCRPVDLIIIVVEPGDVHVRKSGNLPSRLPHPTAHVKHLHTLSEVHHVSEVVLMSSESLKKGLSRPEAAEMEGLGPAILVEVRRKVVITARRTDVSPAHWSFRAPHSLLGQSGILRSPFL